MDSEIVVRDKEVILHMNCLFYPYGVIAKAASSATDTFWVNIEGEKDGVLSITLKPKKPGVNMKEASDKFMNHIIMIMRNR